MSVTIIEMITEIGDSEPVPQGVVAVAANHEAAKRCIASDWPTARPCPGHEERTWELFNLADGSSLETFLILTDWEVQT